MIVDEEAVKKILEEVKPAKLVAATKYVDEKEIEKLSDLGVKYFGENRVQAFLDKYDKYHGSGEFHMIGTLQVNKVKYIIDKVKMIHSVNSLKLIKEIEKQASKHNLVIEILVQVNIAHEESKHGFDETEIYEAFDYLKECPHIKPRGLMMMAPNIEAKDTDIYFKETSDLLKELQSHYPDMTLDQLSMGMSNDYKEAIKYGSTYVRIGRALFKD
ncbi:MAG: YggS family pyridoxal phosphate-dependent enzyme [Thomasclavelia sp.]|jgi:pyridoxal phosphate enzyme (YggS family)|nr:YggS family pyridoxal phosphate-dependent enzyme [Thomasclavelia sp.]